MKLNSKNSVLETKLEELLKSDNNYNKIGDIYYSLHDYYNAIKYYKKFIDNNELCSIKDINVLKHIGKSFLKLHNYIKSTYYLNEYRKEMVKYLVRVNRNKKMEMNNDNNNK